MDVTIDPPKVGLCMICGKIIDFHRVACSTKHLNQYLLQKTRFARSPQICLNCSRKFFPKNSESCCSSRCCSLYSQRMVSRQMTAALRAAFDQGLLQRPEKIAWTGAKARNCVNANCGNSFIPDKRRSGCCSNKCSDEYGRLYSRNWNRLRKQAMRVLRQNGIQIPTPSGRKSIHQHDIVRRVVIEREVVQ